MLYSKKNVNGDAGEHLVAYRVTKTLGWPCRLQDVDLGIDAEMEVQTEEGRSTGDFIKIQIKTFDSMKNQDSHCVYVDDRHIDYWKRLCLPVIVMCVDLEMERVYWKQIFSTEAYRSGGDRRRIDFSLVDDELKVESKESLRMLVYPEQARGLDSDFAKLREALDVLQGDSPLLGWNDVTSGQEKYAEVESTLTHIESLISQYPWRVSSTDLKLIKDAKASLARFRVEVEITRNDLIEGG